MSHRLSILNSLSRPGPCFIKVWTAYFPKKDMHFVQKFFRPAEWVMFFKKEVFSAFRGHEIPGIPGHHYDQWVDLYNHQLQNPKGFNHHRNWGKNIIFLVVEAQGNKSNVRSFRGQKHSRNMNFWDAKLDRLIPQYGLVWFFLRPLHISWIMSFHFKSLLWWCWKTETFKGNAFHPKPVLIATVVSIDYKLYYQVISSPIGNHLSAILNKNPINPWNYQLDMSN